MFYWVHMADRSGPFLWEASPNAREVFNKIHSPMDHETLFLEAQSGDLLNVRDVVRMEPYTGGAENE